MQSVEHPVRAPRKGPRTLVRRRKLKQTEVKLARDVIPDAGRQQSATEFPTRAAGDWPPNTWWP